MTDTGRTVYWHDDALYDQWGSRLMICTWQEACNTLPFYIRPTTLLRQPPPAR